MMSWFLGKEKAEWIVGKLSSTRSSRQNSEGYGTGSTSNSSWGFVLRSLSTGTFGVAQSGLSSRREPSAATRGELGVEWTRVCRQLEYISGGGFSEDAAKKLRRARFDVEARLRMSMVVVLDAHATMALEGIYKIFMELPTHEDKELVVVDTARRGAFFQKKAKRDPVVYVPVEFKDDEHYAGRTDLSFGYVLKTVGYLMASGEKVLFFDNDRLSAKLLGVSILPDFRLDVLKDLAISAQLSN